jgi:hypothetical protein
MSRWVWLSYALVAVRCVCWGLIWAEDAAADAADAADAEVLICRRSSCCMTSRPSIGTHNTRTACVLLSAAAAAAAAAPSASTGRAAVP